jgi:hypothetical protein
MIKLEQCPRVGALCRSGGEPGEEHVLGGEPFAVG